MDRALQQHTVLNTTAPALVAAVVLYPPLLVNLGLQEGATLLYEAEQKSM